MEELKVRQEVNQDRAPNFRGSDGRLFLVRCFSCEPERGFENYSMAVSYGQCYRCGWKEGTNDK